MLFFFSGQSRRGEWSHAYETTALSSRGQTLTVVGVLLDVIPPRGPVTYIYIYIVYILADSFFPFPIHVCHYTYRPVRRIPRGEGLNPNDATEVMVRENHQVINRFIFTNDASPSFRWLAHALRPPGFRRYSRSKQIIVIRIKNQSIAQNTK